MCIFDGKRPSVSIENSIVGNNLFLTNRQKYNISEGYEWLEIRSYVVGKGYGNRIRGSFTKNDLSNSINPFLFNSRSSLVTLDLSYNTIQGYIPDYALWNMSSLLYLDLTGNGINGIPKSFGNLCGLKTLSLESNNLTGQLPELFLNLSGCTKNTLQVLRLNNNMLSGSLPDFTLFSSLRELYLYENRLNGSFPNSLAQLSNLTGLDLSRNQLVGSFPDGFSAMLTSIESLDVSSNWLNGSLPESIGQLSKLLDLDFSSNFLEGLTGISSQESGQDFDQGSDMQEKLNVEVEQFEVKSQIQLEKSDETPKSSSHQSDQGYQLTRDRDKRIIRPPERVIRILQGRMVEVVLATLGRCSMGGVGKSGGNGSGSVKKVNGVSTEVNLEKTTQLKNGVKNNHVNIRNSTSISRVSGSRFDVLGEEDFDLMKVGEQ
ncbi:hypothetical protein LWI28_027246 [Acer negundo]|uniref:Uncharacterized protein n=1 Tax=Acer negundo TaxID=4023 RepID=A0AAD5IXQ2_ACENE|nr:hypothetical protein LWI28_027246 [Acer negundo]